MTKLPINYEHDYPAKNGERRPAFDFVRHGHDADRYNGAMMRTDPLLVRLLKAYSKCDEADKAEIVRLAEFQLWASKEGR